MLRVIARAQRASSRSSSSPTFMGAHEVPPEYRGRQADYVRLVIDEMIPRAAPLAEWCDVFCDRGFFTPEESIAILEAGARAGLKPRIHADELAPSGGAVVAGRGRRAVGRSPRPRDARRHRRAGARPASSRRCCRARRSI